MAMTAPAFDTLATARDLEAAGFERRQAEAAVIMVRDAVTEGGATKAGLAALEIRLYRALLMLAGFIAAVAGLAVGLVKLLP